MQRSDNAPEQPQQRLVRWALWAPLLLALLVAAATYDDYGATFDEALQAEYGELAVDYFASGGKDTRCNEFRDLRYYGPLIEMLPVPFYRGADVIKYEVRHLILGLLSALMIPALWLFGRRFGDPRLAVFIVLAVFTMPRLYGHGFNNSKDASFALLVLWYMATLAATFTGGRLRWSRVLACGVAMGLALCGRPGGFPLLSLYLLGAAATHLLTRPPGGPGPTRAALELAPRLLALVAVAWAVMVLPWPWAHQNPLLHPIESMRAATAFPTVIRVLFDGQYYRSDSLPWYYLIKSLWIATPPGVLALGTIGLIAGIGHQLTAWRGRTAQVVTLTQIWLFSVLALFVVVRPNTYGGIRHFLFILPAIGAFAALGATELLRRFSGRRARCTAWAVLLAVLAAPIVPLVKLHPYQTTYHNLFVGGVAGAADRYWTDYYMSSYVEAIRWINARAADDPDREVEVIIAAGSSTAILQWAREYAADNVRIVSAHSLDKDRKTVAPSDYYIGSTRYRNDLRFPDAPVVHRIGRCGATFTVIKGRE